MNENCFPAIRTERLFLRRLEQSDWAMISYLRTDKTINKFVKRPKAESKEKALEFIEKINFGTDHKTFYYWCISIKGDPTMMGSICLWNFSKDRKIAEVGYDLSSEFQGKGFMSEALKSIIEFAFNNLGVEVIEAYTHRKNNSSKTLLERNNFKCIPGKMDKNNEDNVIFEIRNSR
ncbi:GNAT family N-acetyltransferase [Sinomicrobium sp. M5D2P17]